MSSQPRPISERVTHFVTVFIRVGLVLAAAYALATGKWSVLFAATGTLALSYVPQVLAMQVNIKLPLQFQFAILMFLYASIILGEIGDYYERFWWWDVVLHGFSAFAFGFVGFLTLYLLYARHKLTASPLLVAIFAFSFGMALGAIWEIFEFVMDMFFDLGMQKSGLRDTMWDLIVDAAGAGTASVIGYIYLRFKIRDPFDIFIQWFLRANPRFKANRFLRRPNTK